MTATTDPPLRLRALIISVALIATPMVCGFSYVNFFAPPEAPGLYALTYDGMYRVEDVQMPRSSDPMTAVGSGVLPMTVLPDERDGIICLFLLQPRTAAPATPSMSLYFTVAERGSATRISEPVRLPAIVQEINRGLFRITSPPTSHWDLLRGSMTAAMTRAPGSRTATDGRLMIVLEQAGEPTRVFSIRIAPPERLDPRDAM